MSQTPPLAWGVGTKQLGMGRAKKLMTTGYFAKSIFQGTCNLYNFMVSDLLGYVYRESNKVHNLALFEVILVLTLLMTDARISHVT